MKKFFTLTSLYLAYRKAKAEAFYETTHFHAQAFTKYEQNLHRNLLKLQERLMSQSPDWYLDIKFIGDFSYLPKSVDTNEWANNEGHFRELDPLRDWRMRFKETGKRAPASLRLIIRPTVDFQIVSVLWIIFVGHLMDAAVDRKISFGNCLRRSGGPSSDLNLSSPGLFVPYFSSYQKWREGGLAAMDKALEKGEDVLAITMDIEKFYHRVSPKFLLRPAFLKSINLALSADEQKLTQQLLFAIDTWYSTTPDYSHRKKGAIPVGLSASKIIANVLLSQLDRELMKKLRPIYFGRYVDDFFLVLRSRKGERSAKNVTSRIARELRPFMKTIIRPNEPDSLCLLLPYAKDSELVFAGPKQKIFALSSAHGADLVHQIRDQIRKHSSEYRLLPAVPSTGIEMASRALLATSNAALQADALRKADVLSVRRSGFALLLKDVETYAADLKPDTWAETRREFYGLISRHVITPTGFFDFFSYIPRVFGLMVRCGDLSNAKKLILELKEVAKILRKTTTLGESKANRFAFALCLEQYSLGLVEAAICAATERSVQISSDYVDVLNRLKTRHQELPIPTNKKAVEKLVTQVLLADWGRRPYKDYWFHEQKDDKKGPKFPKELEVRQQLRYKLLRKFKNTAKDLKVPHWPALVFPTRPMSITEIGLVAPLVLSDSALFRETIKFLRGAQVTTSRDFGFQSFKSKSLVTNFVASGKLHERIRIAVTSVETSDEQWKLAAQGKHDRSESRYVAFNSLINRILKEPKQSHYIVLPELSVPLRWALRAARKLASNGISFIAGVEYYRDRVNEKIRNDCLVSLTTRWPGYANSVSILQSKFLPAHGERKQLEELLEKGDSFFQPTGLRGRPIVYEHNGFCFCALVCSDLTNIAHRHSLRGEVDALFALEWNPDTKTFASLVESAASDLHAYVVQANNRRFGDSRIGNPPTKPKQ